MIRVHLAPEPSTFDAEVRQPGLNALAELVGEPSRVRTGPKRPKIADRREDIRSKDFPTYWREALPDLLTAYHRICAYTALYIHRITGAQSVDHMAAKSSHWRDVYEWNNYRLACARVNSRKGVKSPLDPLRDRGRLVRARARRLSGHPRRRRSGAPAHAGPGDHPRPPPQRPQPMPRAG
jgi:5-methylcytosine-specific restriction endonuclease McrA